MNYRKLLAAGLFLGLTNCSTLNEMATCDVEISGIIINEHGNSYHPADQINIGDKIYVIGKRKSCN